MSLLKTCMNKKYSKNKLFNKYKFTIRITHFFIRNSQLRSSFNLLINGEKEAWKRVYHNDNNLLNLLSLNVRGISDETSFSTIAKLEAISNMIEECKSNIILLQETNRNFNQKSIIKNNLLNNFFEEFLIIAGDCVTSF